MLPQGPYHFSKREFLSFTYVTDADAIRAVLPEPFELPEQPVVRFIFSNVPDSTGFGAYATTMTTIPTSVKGVRGSFVHSAFANDQTPIAAGREIWGIPQKLANVSLATSKDTLLGTLEYGPMRVATGTQGYKHETLRPEDALMALQEPLFNLKIIPHVDAKTSRVLEIVKYQMVVTQLHGAWTGPASLQLSPHALAPVSALPVRRVISSAHLVADLILPLGKVIFDYNAPDPTSQHQKQHPVTQDAHHTHQ